MVHHNIKSYPLLALANCSSAASKLAGFGAINNSAKGTIKNVYSSGVQAYNPDFVKLK